MGWERGLSDSTLFPLNPEPTADQPSPKSKPPIASPFSAHSMTIHTFECQLTLTLLLLDPMVNVLQ